MTDLPPPEMKRARRSLLERFSVVWVVPIAALVISLGIAWQNYASRGPLIEIAFSDAEGIRSGNTELRFRDVPVGVVEEVRFSDGLNSVLVGVRLEQDIAPYVDSESEFWVVRPQVTAQGVTGLSTVLSGVYIQGSWDNEAGGLQTSFRGSGAAPVARPDVPGLRITLTSDTGEGMLQGTPILYRGVQVGALADVRLEENGESVLADAFIEAPHDSLISSATRFWNASGFSFSLGPQGATLDVSSLSALVSGGVALENLVSGGSSVEAGAQFQLFSDKQEALSSVFADPEAQEAVNIGLVFSGDVSGLTAGSAVEFQGLRVGQIAGVTGVIDEERFGDRRVRLLATAEIDPTRLSFRDGEPGDAPSQKETLALLDELAQSGVRARLARGSLFVGGLKVVLEQEESVADEAGLDMDADPFPIFPTTSADIPDTADTVEGLLARVNDLPIEALLDSAESLLRNVNAVVGSDAVQAAPEEALALIGDVRGLVGSDEVQQVPNEIAAILADLQAAVTDVRDVLAEFRDAGAATALTEALAQSAPALETANRLLSSAEPAVAELPALVEQLSDAIGNVASTAKTVANLPLADVVSSAAETAEAARVLLTSEEVQQVPSDVSEVLSEIEQTLKDVRDAQLVARASSAVGSAGDAAAQLAQATEDLPRLIDQIEAVAATIESLPLASTMQTAERTLASVNDLLGSEGVRDLPGELEASLAQLRSVLADFQQSGLVSQVNDTLAEAGRTAAAIREATAEVPQVVAGVEELTRTANALPIEELATDLAGLAAAAEAILAADGAQELPASLNGTLTELQIALAELRDGGLISSANQTLASARDAAAAVEQAAESLPQLAARLDALADQAEQTLAGYDEGSELTREAQATLREVQAAARAVSALARQIERNPNSLLLGR
jgi:paraquat-inducible protein B